MSQITGATELANFIDITVCKTTLKYFLSSAEIRKSIALFEGSQDPPICPDKKSIKMKINTEPWWNGNDRENRSAGRETCPSATLSTTNLTWNALRSNLGHHAGRMATNRLNPGNLVVT